MKVINNTEFNEITAKGLVVVDFFANWCGPCKMLTPVLEELDEQLDNVTFVKVDVDQEEGLARKYGIFSIPHMIIFKDGKAVDQITGFTSKDALLEKINPLL